MLRGKRLRPEWLYLSLLVGCSSAAAPESAAKRQERAPPHAQPQPEIENPALAASPARAPETDSSARQESARPSRDPAAPNARSRGDGQLAALIAAGKVKGTAQELLTEGEHWVGVSAEDARASEGQQRAAERAREAAGGSVRWTVPYPSGDATPALADLARTLSRRRSAVRLCYERVAGPTLAAHVVIADLTLTPRGSVVDISIDPRSSAPPPTHECVLDVLRRTRLPGGDRRAPLRTSVAAVFASGVGRDKQ